MAGTWPIQTLTLNVKCEIMFFIERLSFSQYYWLDEKGKKTKTPAACYVDFVMSFVHKLITDESVFPTKYGEPN